ncbi:50S ribosomal protein L3 [Candidatus Rhabdochlamydia oedothoracis]|uniref:Large ribosomal subunit protein uL3 n=1 Tax=Candidatus Rhabdochlamydia oedothoracis TaxID=2720720 RepID=A0ABX8V4A0_9BACT|nr:MULTISPECIES: 50S ribosomal protein L3 [Rhabdochlamydia]KAG6559494.1 50S ribosomal protein L3 [Candidatus Rhabdochlamydia sp. W815]QYF48290.1 50S ribosomal protein L3 [Candidatus Rhabdochlamydia oedothoracis]
MTLKFQGKKKGMTMRFDAQGNQIVCTVILVEPNVIAQIKSSQGKDGYNAVQLAAYKVKPSKVKNVSKPLQGHFAKAKIEPRSSLKESRVENVEDFQVAQELNVSYFNEISYVDISGISKGKGHQGVMKRHNFAGGPASHGSGFHRHGGSTGMRSTPGRCLPGQKKSGRMGNEMVTTQNLRVVKVDLEKNVILVGGAVPGPRNGLVYISKAKKKA